MTLDTFYWAISFQPMISSGNFHCQQDLINNPQYTLIIEKGRFAEKYFSSSDPVKNPEGSILWNRIRNNRKSIESDVATIESVLMADQKFVFFGPTIGTTLRFNSIPCHVEASSGSIYKVGVVMVMLKLTSSVISMEAVIISIVLPEVLRHCIKFI